MGRKRSEKVIRDAYIKLGRNKLTTEDLQGNPKLMTYRQFKNRVLATARLNNISIEKATKKEVNTERFTSVAERARVNVLEGIKGEFKETYKKITTMMRQRDSKGRFIKEDDFNPANRLSWNKDLRGYTFIDASGIAWLIDITNSPKQVNLVRL